MAMSVFDMLIAFLIYTNYIIGVIMIYKIRDCVDVYTLKDNVLMFYFINTRKTYEYKVNDASIKLITMIDGKKNLDELTMTYNDKFESNVSKDSVKKILDFLVSINVVVELDSKNMIEENSRYERQINYLSELSLGNMSGINNNEKIQNTKFVIFGVGAVGGDIAILLAMAGVKNIVLIDHDKVEETDIARHMYFKEKNIGMNKVDALKKELEQINSEINVEAVNIILKPNTDIDNWVSNADFIINSADEPYIGYTSGKIAKKCYELGKPHYIAGGFDIHVMSTGELIIPGVTPCVNCYMRYFKRKLANWTPENKKVVDVYNEYGGFASQSLFSASYAVVQIMKYICGCDFESEKLTRGEVDFANYEIQYLDVERDPNCPVCGGAI